MMSVVSETRGTWEESRSQLIGPFWMGLTQYETMHLFVSLLSLHKKAINCLLIFGNDTLTVQLNQINHRHDYNRKKVYLDGW